MSPLSSEHATQGPARPGWRSRSPRPSGTSARADAHPDTRAGRRSARSRSGRRSWPRRPVGPARSRAKVASGSPRDLAYVPMTAEATEAVPAASNRTPIGFPGTRPIRTAPTPTNEAIPDDVERHGSVVGLRIDEAGDDERRHVDHRESPGESAPGHSAGLLPEHPDRTTRAATARGSLGLDRRPDRLLQVGADRPDVDLIPQSLGELPPSSDRRRTWHDRTDDRPLR